ncbi:MAG: GtrA domain-containing protein [Thermocaproicibacter melissae]|uniref:GtrA family protein n=1 Tax=Thermocaproicibacter melissae TaxID=2966552 RepID=UPI0024B17CB9|nr:GtrA family protein [Thermocaproicibacter melissae]WBY64165.1 GtrA family protein [Thermocaproicibacter melissae]
MNLIRKLWKFMTTPEMLLYIAFGVMTTLINILAFQLANGPFGWSWQAANIFAWILAVLFAFITNKLFVFKSKSLEPAVLWREFAEFIGARLFSLGVDYLCMWLLIDVLGWNELLSKIADNVIVVIINYVLSKLVIFKKK